MTNSQYDAIIIGGRPAGASIAIRLAEADFNVLVVDRATFPSKPAVPSMPLIMPHTIQMLEEIGMSEDAIASSGAKLVRLQMEMGGHFLTEIDFAKAMEGDPRVTYFYSVQRDKFDHALRQLFNQYDNITSKEGFGVQKLLQDDTGKVTGIEGSNGEQFTADVVIGADGRYSFVASQVKAEPFNVESEYNTDFYFAYWRGGTYNHPDAMHTMHIYSTLEGYQYLIFPVGNNEVAVSIQMIHDLLPKPASQSIEEYYEENLKKYPVLWNQIKSAERISDVWGLKNVQNGYRQVGGDGWVLAGDAVHYKDSIDAQGIYDALLSTKILAKHLISWKNNQTAWTATLDNYKTELLEETYPMFLETQGRLKREVYDIPPPFVVKNIIRRAMEDPTYQKQFVGYATRRFPPTNWASPQLMLGALLRGIGRDIKGIVS